MNETSLVFRIATRADVPAIVRLLADDELGQTREHPGPPVPDSYYTAFEAISQDGYNELVVVEADGTVIGTLQLTIIPYLTYQGGSRAVIEAVRVGRRFRSQGVGERLFERAIARARERGCHVVQLTTDKRRVDAHRFYQRLGFAATHEGMKLHLPLE